MKPPSPFDVSGPSKLAKALMTGRRRSIVATEKTKRQREAGSDPSQIYGLSEKGDESVRQYRLRNKK